MRQKHYMKKHLENYGKKESFIKSLELKFITTWVYVINNQEK